MRNELIDICNVVRDLKMTYFLLTPSEDRHFAFSKTHDKNRILRALSPKMPQLMPLNTFYIGSLPKLSRKKSAIKGSATDLKYALEVLKFAGGLSVSIGEKHCDDADENLVVDHDGGNFIINTSSKTGEVMKLACFTMSPQAAPEPTITAQILKITSKAGIVSIIKHHHDAGYRLFSFNFGSSQTSINFHGEGDRTVSLPIDLEDNELSYDASNITIASVYTLNIAYHIDTFLYVIKAAKLARVSIGVSTETKNLEYKFKRYVDDGQVEYSIQSTFALALDPERNQKFDYKGKVVLA